MSENKFAIYLNWETNKIEGLANLSTLKMSAIDGLIIDARKLGLSSQEFTSIRTTLGDSCKLLIVDDLVFCQELGGDGVVFNSLASIGLSFKKDNPALILGGIANDMATSKNWELANADFILFDSVNSGSDALPKKNSVRTLKSFIPKKEVYGWSILTINTPVYANNTFAFNELETLMETTKISGVVLSYPELSTLNKVKSIHQLSTKEN